MTHSDSPEFLAILERVPRWHILTPGVKKSPLTKFLSK